MSSQPNTNVPIVLGAMTIGNGPEQSRVSYVSISNSLTHTNTCFSDLKEAGRLLDIFRAHGHAEVDTSRYYGSGTSEEYLGKLDWQKRGIIMETKFYPTVGKGMDQEYWTHRPEHLRENLMRSLKALKADKIDMWYLHGPDRTTPYVDTLRAVNELHKEGLFDKFGISNYMAWEVSVFPRRPPLTDR